MIKEKEFDCIKFKYELQEKLLKSSGAHNLREYVNYANKIAQKSPLHKTKEALIVFRPTVYKTVVFKGC